MPDTKSSAYAKEDVDRLKSVFKQVDVDGDGLLTFAEMRELLNRCAGGDGMGLSDPDLQKLYASVDTNHNGKVEFDELVDFLCKEATNHLQALAQSIRYQMLGENKDAVVVCILGSTAFSNPDTEELVKATAKELGAREGLVFCSGGNKGVQETWAQAVGDGQRLFQIMPAGKQSGYPVGTDIIGGATAEERQMVVGSVGDVYLCFEGGPGVAKEARVAFSHGSALVPMIRTGGASEGMFDFPAAAMTCPAIASKEQFAKLSDKASIADSAKAAAELAVALGKEVAAARAKAARGLPGR